MIDAGVKIIDRIIDLLRTREQNKGELFEDFVQPLFEDMILIHQDYIRSLTSLIQEIDDLESEDQAYNVLLHRKSNLEHLRVKAHSFLEEAKKPKSLPKSANCFFDACVQYFMMQSGQFIGTYKHHYIDLLAFLSGEESTYVLPKNVQTENDLPAPKYSTEIARLLLLFLDCMKNKWSEVTAQYAYCRFNLLK